jgi:hypothetical protein
MGPTSIYFAAIRKWLIFILFYCGIVGTDWAFHSFLSSSYILLKYVLLKLGIVLDDVSAL